MEEKDIENHNLMVRKLYQILEKLKNLKEN